MIADFLVVAPQSLAGFQGFVILFSTNCLLLSAYSLCLTSAAALSNHQTYISNLVEFLIAPF